MLRVRRTALKPAVFAIVAICLAPVAARASIIEDFEDPDVPAGSSAPTLPPGWHVFSNNGFIRIDDLLGVTPPASGQILELSGQNTGIYRILDDKITSNTTYTLSAAIGALAFSPKWSIQLWADSNGSGVFEGSGSDTFIGQQFADNAGAKTPAIGSWTLNSFSFDSASTPSLIGKHLVVFLNNYGEDLVPGSPRRSAYDNIGLETVADAPAGVPEPASWALMLSGFGLAGTALRRRRSAVPA